MTVHVAGREASASRQWVRGSPAAGTLPHTNGAAGADDHGQRAGGRLSLGLDGVGREGTQGGVEG
jgi:hypothetical protein